MVRDIVITGTGKDQVGIVACVSEILYKRGCNLLDSSMTLLRGEFALILMASLPDGVSLEDVRNDLRELEHSMGLLLNVRELEPACAPSFRTGIPLMISVYGADRSGIVCGVTKKLADLGVNITDLQTKQSSEGGQNLFVMILEVAAPQGMGAEELDEKLVKECQSLGMEVTVQELDIVEI